MFRGSFVGLGGMVIHEGHEAARRVIAMVRSCGRTIAVSVVAGATRGTNRFQAEDWERVFFDAWEASCFLECVECVVGADESNGVAVFAGADVAVFEDASI